MDERFWLLDFYDEDHSDDLIMVANNEELICIVDEEAGGIIAYVVGQDNADTIMKGLTK